MQLNESTFGSQNARMQKQVIEFDNQDDIKSNKRKIFLHDIVENSIVRMVVRTASKTEL